VATVVIAPTIESWINQAGHGLKFHWEMLPILMGMIGLVLKIAGLQTMKMPVKA